VNKLDNQDLSFAVLRLPSNLKAIMKAEEWKNLIFVGGGYLRSIVAREPINDIDVFVRNEKDAELLAFKLAKEKKGIYKTDNAFTIKGKITIQIIYRWLFEKPEDVSNSFDFTICCAVIYFDGSRWDSFCDGRFYIDLASKRLVYRSPIRNEDAGGSMLRVLKYYQKGYRIPLDSMGAVIARLIKGIDTSVMPLNNEAGVAKIVTGMLRVVDPAIDPLHEAHLPSQDKTITEEKVGSGY
jgi:hypothetical protein